MAMRYSIAIVGSLAGWLAAGCSEPAPAASGPAARVVSLHDVTTELVVALGAADRLVGVAEPVEVQAEVSAAIARVPRVGDLESILAVHPTIVVGLAIVAAQDPALVARLREAGVAVWLAEPTTLDDVFAVTREVAARIGVGPAGDRLAARLASGTAARPVPDPARHRVRVFVYDCCDPPFTAGGKTLLNDLIRRAGGDNVFADLAAAWTHVSWEEVLARRPELVVIDAYHHDGQGEVADKQRAVRAISALAALPTVVVPLGCALGGPRSLEGLARLRAAIGAGA
jgi:ABC-type Fe3+-hydroxamate transport system substrate-binding protein